MQEDIDADQIGEPERRRPRPAERGPGAGVHFFKRHAQLVHQANRIQHRISADAIGDEIWGILGDDDSLAEPVIAELGERFDHIGTRGRAGNDFNELEIARRIEKMRAGPVLLPFVGKSLGDAAHGQTGGVGGDDRSGLANFGDAREQCALDLEVFRDDFDDPVRFGAELQIVFKISRDDAVFQAARKKRGGLGFCGGSQARAHDAIANFGTREGQPALCFLGGKLARDDIEQRAPNAGVGDVRGNSRAHGSGAQDHDFFDGSFHRGRFRHVAPV